MIPCFGITDNTFEVALYDSVNDVLLLSDTQPIFNDDQSLSFPAIIHLWMIVHHPLFLRGLGTKTVEKCGGSSDLRLTEEEIQDIINGSDWFFQIDKKKIDPILKPGNE